MSPAPGRCEHRRVTLLGPEHPVRAGPDGRAVQLGGLCRECGTFLRRRTAPSRYGPWEPVPPGALDPGGAAGGRGTDAA